MNMQWQPCIIDGEQSENRCPVFAAFSLHHLLLSITACLFYFLSSKSTKESLTSVCPEHSNVSRDHRSPSRHTQSTVKGNLGLSPQVESMPQEGLSSSMIIKQVSLLPQVWSLYCLLHNKKLCFDKTVPRFGHLKCKWRIPLLEYFKLRTEPVERLYLFGFCLVRYVTKFFLP